MTTATITNPVKVGDVFYSSWGYDQTNVDYAVVVKVTPKGCYIQEVEQFHRDDLSQRTADYVVPSPTPKRGAWRRDPDGNSFYDSEYVPPARFHKVQSYTPSPRHPHPRVYLARNSYSNWSLYDGQPKYQTAPGYGH